MEEHTHDKGLSPGFYSQFLNEGIYFVKDNKAAPPKQPREAIIAENEAVYTENPFAFSGNAQSHIVLLFSYPGKNDLPVKDKIFLEKILGAIGLTLESVAWLNMADYPDAIWADLAANERIKTLLAFNVKISFFPDMPFGENTIINGKNIFAYHSLDDISLDGEKKKVLWAGLKKMFASKS